MQRRAQYTPRPSLEVARYRFMPLPPEPFKQELNALEGYRDWENRQKSSSYESLTGQSLLNCPLEDSSFYEGSTLAQDFDRISQYSAYSDATTVLSTAFGRTDSLDTIAEQPDHLHLARGHRQSQLPPVPYHMLCTDLITAPVDCRLSSASTTESNSPRLAKRSLKRSATPDLFCRKNLDTFNISGLSVITAERPVTPVPSLTHTQSLASFDETTPSTRSLSSGTIVIMHSPTEAHHQVPTCKPHPVFIATGTRNISSPMPSPVMNNNYDLNLGPSSIHERSLEIAYQPTRCAPAAPSPVVVEKSHFDSDTDDEQPTYLTRMKKSIPDFKAANRSRTNLNARTVKKTTFAEPCQSMSIPSPLAPPLLPQQLPPKSERQQQRQESSSFSLPNPNASTARMNFSRNAIGQASVRPHSPAKLSKRPSIKQSHATTHGRQRAGTAGTRCSEMSTRTSATLVETMSPTPTPAASKHRLSFAVSTKSGKRSGRRLSVERFKRWARKVMRC